MPLKYAISNKTQGNIRLSYTWDTQRLQVKTLEENHYYPFGLQHGAYYSTRKDVKLKVQTNNEREIRQIPADAVVYKYKYQGQERQDELNLNWDSFKYRNYDYALGRFMSIDPLAEKYPYNSTYAFQENKMGLGRELEGKELDISNWLLNDAVKNPNGIGAHVAGFTQGLIDSGISAYNTIRHPVETLKGIGNLTISSGNLNQAVAMDNLLGTQSANTLISFNSSVSTGLNNLINGNGFERGEVVGNIAGTIAIGEGVGMAFNVASSFSKSSSITNPVPSTLARVIPANISTTTLGAPGASDVFVTAASDIEGLNASQVANKLTIPQSTSGYKVIKFSTPKNGLASPINRTNPGFVGRGRTAGGAREFTVPNIKIPNNAKIKKIK